jgi:cytochrome c oxidase assembly protein subunit 15
MIHRYLATGVGVLIIVLTVATWLQWRRARADSTVSPPVMSPWWPTFTLVWVCLQGAFGALTVTMKLFPAIVTLHLMGGVVLLALLCVQAVRHTQAVRGVQPAVLAAPLRLGVLVTGALVALQVVLGGWVSTNYAVLACTTFPTCQGSWWPVMDFAQGFQLWRPLGLLQDGSHISFAGLTAIHYAHRLVAYGVLLTLAWLAWRLHRATALRLQARWLAGLALLQLATGLSNVVLGWPLLAAVLHTGGAAALVVVLTWALSSSRAALAPQGSFAPSSAPRISA